MTLKKNEDAKDKTIRELRQRVVFLSEANKNLREEVAHLRKEKQQFMDPDGPVRWN